MESPKGTVNSQQENGTVAVRIVDDSRKGDHANYEGRVMTNVAVQSFTLYVALTTVVACSGGLLFGYNIGISGGVTSMDGFLKRFFINVYYRKQSAETNNYCHFDDRLLGLFTSSLWISGLIATIFASQVTSRYGRRLSMLVAGFGFFIGSAVDGGAINLPMLFLGRILLGVGVGFANQVVPLYLSEMAPAHLRGTLGSMFQLAATMGIVIAAFVNAQTTIKSWGWRLSLGLCCAPACILVLGGLFLPEAPNSLIERGRLEEARKVLRKIRGTENIDDEFNVIVQANDESKDGYNPVKVLLLRSSRPQLVMGILIPFFTQVTGINAILFYSPQVFEAVGFGDRASTYSAVIIGAVNFVGCVISMVLVDRKGRRFLFQFGGTQMIISQVAVGFILDYGLGDHGDLSPNLGKFVLVLICLYVAAFSYSWGPLGWLVPTEIFSHRTRSTGQSMAVFISFSFTFLIGQIFPSMLCALKAHTFVLFAAFIVVMTLFVTFFLPETKGVPIDLMQQIWGKHWFWKRYVNDSSFKSARIEFPKSITTTNNNNVKIPIILASGNLGSNAVV